MRIKIAFNLDDNQYNDYEDIIETFMNDLREIGIEGVEVFEREGDNEIKYLVDIYNDGSDIETMTRKQLINFAEEQVHEWYDEISLQVTNEHGNVAKEYAEGYKIANKVVNENYKIRGIAEVEELFKLPALTIPFKEGDKA